MRRPGPHRRWPLRASGCEPTAATQATGRASRNTRTDELDPEREAVDLAEPRVLVCGSRRWPWPVAAARVLDRLARRHGDGLVVVEGAAAGADQAAHQWCDEHGLGVDRHRCHPVDWQAEGRARGPAGNAPGLNANGLIGGFGCSRRTPPDRTPVRPARPSHRGRAEAHDYGSRRPSGCPLDAARALSLAVLPSVTSEMV
ncbi:SLOG family protein [Streptomyces sp. NPDC054794]